MMAVIGFNFTKITAKKNKPLEGKVSITNNIAIIDISEAKVSSPKKKSIKFTFDFVTKYEPKIGSINLEGEVLALEDAKEIDKILDDWKNKKMIPKEMVAKVFNTALERCNIQALILSQQVNLPPPLKLPKVTVTTKK